MRVGKRLFPYPVINNSKKYSSYKNSEFKLLYDLKIDNKSFLLKDIYYYLNNNLINNLILEGLVKVVCIVECSSTIFRKVYEISNEAIDIEIPVHNLEGKVVVSSYAYATKDINSLIDDDFLDDYLSYSFNVEKYDILAIDDGFTHKVVYDENKDKKISSIFLVIKNMNKEDLEKMKVEYDINKIIISLPEKEFNIYNKIQHNEYFESIFFSFLVIPALTKVLDIVVKKDSIDEIEMDYNWFASIKKSYYKLYNKELTSDAIFKIGSVELAQEIMNYPIIKGIDSIFDLTNNGYSEELDDE